MWVYLGFMQRFDREQRFVEHPIGIREITNLTLTTSVPLRSAASQSMVESGILSSQDGPKSLLEIEFDGSGRKEIADFRPHLPVLFDFDSRREIQPSTALRQDCGGSRAIRTLLRRWRFGRNGRVVDNPRSVA